MSAIRGDIMREAKLIAVSLNGFANNEDFTRIAESLLAAEQRGAERERERAAKIVIECLCDEEETELSASADDFFNDLYRRPMAERLDSLGKFVAAAIRNTKD